MTADDPTRPARMESFPNGELGVVWADGHESWYPGHALRCACGCAFCVDETSGRKVLRDEQVPQDVHIVEMHPVGNYGFSVRWSDGHDTGIYRHDRLREMCPCCC